MTETQLFYADIFIRKTPVKTALSIYSRMESNAILVDEYKNCTDAMWQALCQLTSREKAEIRTYLLKEKIFETVDHKIPKDILTEIGEKIQEVGSIANYKELLLQEAATKSQEIKQEKKEEKKLSWPQRHWIIVAFTGAFFASVLTIILELIVLPLKEQKPIKTQTIPAVRDTVYLYRIDTLYIITNTKKKGVKK